MRRIGYGVAVLAGLVLLALLALRAWPLPHYEPYALTPEEAAFVARIDVPEFAPDWRFDMFESFDGTPLRWGETGNATTAKGTLIYVPGYNGTIDAYAEQFGLWAREGWHVVGLDMRGQGGSAGNPHGEKLPAFIRSGEVVNARDIRGFVRSLGIADRPVVLVGSSYGGLMTTLAVMEEPELVDAYLALVPAYKPKFPGDREAVERQTRRMVQLGLGDRYIPDQMTWRPFASDFTEPDFCPTGHARIFHQLAIQADDPSQRVSGMTFSMIADWARLGREIHEGARGSFGVPTTVVVSTNDALVDNDWSADICERDANCRYRVWDDVTHCITLGPDVDVLRVAEEANALLERL